MQPHSGVSRNARQTTTSELYLGVARALENGVTLRLCISRGDFERIGRRASESSGIGRCGHSIYVIALFLLHGHSAYFVRFPGTWTTSWIGDGFSRGKGSGGYRARAPLSWATGSYSISSLRRTAANMRPAIPANPTLQMYNRATPSRWSRDTRATSGLARISRRVLCGPYGKDVVSRSLLSLAKAHLRKLEPRGRDTRLGVGRVADRGPVVPKAGRVVVFFASPWRGR